MRILLTCIAFLSLLCTCARAQTFSAILQPSDAEVRQVNSAGWDAFLAEHRRQNAAGFRLTDLESYREGGNERQYLGLYTESPLQDSVGKAASWSEFIKLKRAMVKRGYTMVDVAGVVLNESDVDYYGVWVKEDNPTIHKVWLLDSEDTILKRTRAMARDRFKIKRVHVLDVPNGEPSFVVLYHFSPIDRYNFLYFADDLETFNGELAERRNSQVQLIDFDRFRSGQEVRYVAVFQDGEYESAFLPAMPLSEVQGQADRLAQVKGLKMANLSVD